MKRQAFTFILAALACASTAAAASFSWLGTGATTDWTNPANWWNIETGPTTVAPAAGDLAFIGFPAADFSAYPRPVINTVLYSPANPLQFLCLDYWDAASSPENSQLTIATGGGLEVARTLMNNLGMETATIHITGGYLRCWTDLKMGMTAGGTSQINIDSGFLYTPTLIFGPGNSNIDIEPGGTLFLGADQTSAVQNWINADKITGGGGNLELQVIFGLPIEGLTAVTALPPVPVPPAIASLVPPDNASNVPVASNLVATFNKPIALSGTGSITLKNLSGSTDIPVALPVNVVISERTLTIDPPSNLAAGQQYAVEISADAITDLSDPVQYYAGLLSTDVPNWSFTASPAGAHVKVFLLGGQSNAVGTPPNSGLPTNPVNLQQPQYDILFYANLPSPALTTLRPGSGGSSAAFGPEVTFGRTVANASPNVTYAIIKHAVGGTGLWDDWDPATGLVYTDFRATVAAGLAALHAAGYTTEIVGMAWHQGESDAIEGYQAAYQSNLTDFIADIRTRYGANLPFLIGEIGNFLPPYVAAFDTVIAAQQAVAAADPWSVFVPAKDLSFMDSLHFDAAGQIVLGERFAAGYATLVPAGDNFADWISNPAFGINPGERGFNDDPDVDGLDNALEAWFGTHPGEFSQGLVADALSGNQFTFIHPQNVDSPDDLTGYYRWSPNLIDWYDCDGVDGPPGGATVTTGSVTTNGSTTVTATAGVTMEILFLRAGVLAN